MKKLATLLLCLILILSLAACGRSDAPESAGEKIPANNTTPAAEPADGSGDTAVPANGKGESTPTENAAITDSGDAAAELEKKYAGLTEDGLTWEYDPAAKTVTISGEGPMRDYFDEAPEWELYCEEAETVVIDDGVTSVGAAAFLYFTAVTDVRLGDSVEFIGDSAFCDCYSLRTVNFPDGLRYIAGYAFNNALLHSENGFTFPDGLLYLGEQSFYSAFKESTVTIPASLSFIGKGSFANCFVSAFAVDPGNLSYASEDGILYDKGMTTLINYPADKHNAEYAVPETVTAILQDAIEVTHDLEKLVIPASVTTIEEGSIFWNYALSSIEVDPANGSYRSVDGVLFSGDGKVLISYPIASDRTEYTVPEGTERIGRFALSQASNLAAISLPKSLTVMEDFALDNCFSLAEIRYGGTEADWQSITVGEFNELLSDGSVLISCAE